MNLITRRAKGFLRDIEEILLLLGAPMNDLLDGSDIDFRSDLFAGIKKDNQAMYSLAGTVAQKHRESGFA